MKKAKKVIIAILIIVVIILAIVFGVKAIIDQKTVQLQEIQTTGWDSMFSEFEVQKQDVTTYVKGNGEVTSFDIKKIPVESYESVADLYVSDGEKVDAKQRLMKVTSPGSSRTVKAPIAGMFFAVEENGSNQYMVYNLEEVGVKIQVAETDVVNIKEGQKAIVKISSIGKEVEGVVDYVSNLPQNGKFTVRIKVDYREDVRFGYSAHVSIVTSEKNDTVVVPYKAVTKTEDGRYYVYKAEVKQDLINQFTSGTDVPEEKRTYVEVGEINSNQVEILSGLEVGEKIVYSNW